MLQAVRLLLGLAGIAAAGAALAHAGVLPHSHPHLGLDVLVAALVGAICGVVWGQTPFSTTTEDRLKKDGAESGV